jgi:hypothetical protein
MLVDDMEEPGNRVPVGEPKLDLLVRTTRPCKYLHHLAICPSMRPIGKNKPQAVVPRGAQTDVQNAFSSPVRDGPPVSATSPRYKTGPRHQPHFSAPLPAIPAEPVSYRERFLFEQQFRQSASRHHPPTRCVLLSSRGMRRDAATPSALATTVQPAPANPTMDTDEPALVASGTSIDERLSHTPQCPDRTQGAADLIGGQINILVDYGVEIRETGRVLPKHVAEVRSVYNDLLKAEGDCIRADLRTDIDSKSLDEQQWRDLNGLYTHLLNKHYDFYIATYPDLTNLITLQSMPERMWIRAILPFLGIFRQRLPASTEDDLPPDPFLTVP